jgi:hypothetical protein
MRMPLGLMAVCWACFMSAAALAQAPASSPHDPSDLHLDPGHAHRPAGVAPAGHDGHAHPDIDIAHGIVTETPVPETTFMLSYALVGSGGAREHALVASFEYAFVREFGLELTVPYALLDPAGGGPAGRLGNVELAAKWATYAFADRGLIPALGVAVGLPTGRDERGVGSDHVIDLEPFARIGWVRGPLQVVGTVNLGIPLNQAPDERDAERLTLAHNLALIYEVRPHVQALLEFNGESTFGDEERHAVYASPGLTFEPFADESVNVGVGVSLPLTGDRDFDYAVNLRILFHL